MKPDKQHDVCPKCGLSKLQMVKGETRTCPICGHTWTREQPRTPTQRINEYNALRVQNKLH